MTKKFKKWSSLNQFHEVKKGLNYPKIWSALKANSFKIPYGFKVKLHGTNACVRIESDGKVVPQKRSSDVPCDIGMTAHFGFSSWVADNESYFSSLAKSDRSVYVYGEWCGKGVQQSVACSETDTKHFYVFAIDEVLDHTGLLTRHYEPSDIEAMLGEKAPNNLIVIPWHMHMEFDFESSEEVKKQLVVLNSKVEKIGEKDPLINELFGIDGAGEGLVAYPLLGAEVGQYQHDEEFFNWFNFKAKSEHHRVNKTKTAVQFDPDKFAESKPLPITTLPKTAYCRDSANRLVVS